MSERKNQISRRDFLAAGLALAGTGLCPQSARAVEVNAITKVHVVFKTHLDIGFTDLGERVVQRYLTAFIPQAMKLAEAMRKNGDKSRFRWTTGSWLIYKYLEEADDPARKRMEDAILAGDICWHALPFTMHSEMLDASLFDLGMNISKTLDKRFGKKTTGAKMTDVPGHTRSIVPKLQAAGIKFLHIGVNPASSPPMVPHFFNWQAPDGASVAVMYGKDYGGEARIPGSSEAVSIILAGDNHGPQSEKDITSIYQELEKRFPGAEMVASDLSQIATTFSDVATSLPVVKSELGDSWIHGVGSDPLKVAQLREMSRLRRTWIRSGDLDEGSPLDLAFGVPLVMVAEHTWGLDVKTHLKSWDVYTPEALAEARKSERFKRMEASWQEKRDFIQNGIQALPAAMKAQAMGALETLEADDPNPAGWEKIDRPGDIIELPQFLIGLDPNTGALSTLQNRKTGRQWASVGHPLALFSYQTFSKADYDRFMNQYLTARFGWALQDFGKPGMEKFEALSRVHLPRLNSAWRREDERSCSIVANIEVLYETGKAVPGCPERLTLEYGISKTEPIVETKLQWFGKQANRLPEAMWLSFVPSVDKDGNWVMDKMGQDVAPRDIVNNGGHKMHAVAEGIRYSDSRDTAAIETLDAPLVAPGERTLLNFDNATPSPNDGMHFCLYNNVWGTNFVMWFDDDMRFRFTIRC